MYDLSYFPYAELARGCAEELRHIDDDFIYSHDCRYCQELYRRAFIKGDTSAFELFYSCFQSIVLYLIKSDSNFPNSGEEASYFVNDVFARLWIDRFKSEAIWDDSRKMFRILRAYASRTIVAYVARNKQHRALKSLEDVSETEFIGAPSIEELISQQLAAQAFRFLNAGFFRGIKKKLLRPDQAMALDSGPYQLGVNIGQFWGTGAKDLPIPESLLELYFGKQKNLEMDIRVTSLDIEIDPPNAKLLLPRTGDSRRKFFRLKFERTGRHFIEIDLLFHGHLLQSRELEVYILKTKNGSLPQDAIPLQSGRITFSRTSELDSDTLDPLKQRPSRLTIVAQRITPNIDLRFYNITELRSKKVGFQRSILTDQSLTQLLKEVHVRLAEVMLLYANTIGSNLTIFTESIGQLAEIGHSFYRALLDKPTQIGPRPVKPVKLTLEPGQIIQVTPLSSQLGVPWELLYERPVESYDKHRITLCPTWREHGLDPKACPGYGNPTVVCPYGFWGYRYIIEQLPYRLDSGTPPRGLSMAMQIRNDIPLRLTVIINSTFELLDSHLESLEQLTGKINFRLSKVATKDGLYLALCDIQRQADILYFYTHGGFEGTMPVLVIGAGERIKEVDLHAWKINLTRRRPLVVLNACGSAAYTPDQTENLIEVFCNSGAAGVIGTQCLVDESLASEFILRFFKAFLKRQATVGQALFEARNALLCHKKTDGKLATSWPDPRGLVYSLFAAADIMLGQPIFEDNMST